MVSETNTPDPSGVPVLVVDDDPDVLGSLSRGLRLAGFQVATAEGGSVALRTMKERRPAALVLDVNMPDLDGVSVITALRALGDEIPICVLSARATVDDRITGLEAGADDYLTKPFELGELVARLHALLRRRANTVEPATAVVEHLRVDTASRRVWSDGHPVDLTRREFELLNTFAEHPGLVLSREQLLSQVWGYDFATETNVVDVFVGYLRRKLEAHDQPRIIQTVRGVGFVLRTESRR
ncbi:response regulator transcription factor [Williamsia sterculiae]|uniref:Two component transcriptional regulator, winged helix family n=1 Tax=Williamsia sterculiae TaxID=1344003 RepID=A0A1N7DET2_9NOCA|nr:response regulator transcription factor [Williamsia sterculiae]SIR74265.1 two component transcriptional regulator, winged helix family [Williamsia sterculiae]